MVKNETRLGYFILKTEKGKSTRILFWRQTDWFFRLTSIYLSLWKGIHGIYKDGIVVTTEILSSADIWFVLTLHIIRIKSIWWFAEGPCIAQLYTRCTRCTPWSCWTTHSTCCSRSSGRVPGQSRHSVIRYRSEKPQWLLRRSVSMHSMTELAMAVDVLCAQSNSLFQ